MISKAQILRLVEMKQFARLVERVLSNGRPCSAPIHMRLTTPAILPTAALALAVQRYLELSYDCRSEEGDRLVSLLVNLQQPSGLFGEGKATDDDRIAASSMAIRALTDYFAADESFDEWHTAQDSAGHVAVRFSAAMALERAARALLERRALQTQLGGQTVTAQIIQWQLGNSAEAKSASIEEILGRVVERNTTRMKSTHNSDTSGPFAEAA